MSVLIEPLQNALYYSSHYQFATLPLHGVTTAGCNCGNPDCLSPGKHPNTLNGLKNASLDPAVLTALFSNKPSANIGIATGPISNIFVVDVDGAQGEASLASFPPLPPTLTSTTGRGRHLVFRYPHKKVYTRAGKFASGLDIRGEGGYIVAPPSIHYTGVVYQWLDPDCPIATAPDWLLDIICQPPADRVALPLPPAPSASNDKWTVDEVRDMLSFIDADLSYDDWIAVGMALHSDGHSLAVWDEWSKRGSKYRPGCTIGHWKSFRPNAGISFGTVVHMAALSGWKPKEIANPMSLDDHPAREFIMRVRNGEFSVKGVPINSPQTTAPQPSPAPSPQLFDPLKIPGLVGDTVREIVETSQKPQPELALLNTLAALGAVFGRRYASPMDTRTNIYAVGIAVTAAGKDHSRRFIKRLMAAAQLDSFLGEDTIISGAGLLTSISKRPAQVMHLDEFGMLLEAITDTKGASYMKAASKVITEMYSTSSNIFFGGQYADKKTDTIKIPSPNLCIYGTTTPEKYISSLNKSVVASGELNRFIVIRPAIDRPTRRRYMGSASPSSQLTSQWAALVSAPTPNHSLFTPDAIPVSWAGLEDRLWDMGLYEDSQIANNATTGALWGRYRENVIKVAMIFAIARNPVVPIITGDDLDTAEAIVSQAVTYAVELAEEHMSDSQHEKDCQDIVQAIKKRGGRVTQSALCTATRRMNGKQRDDALRSLLDQELISIDTDLANKAAGRRASIIRII